MIITIDGKDFDIFDVKSYRNITFENCKVGSTSEYCADGCALPPYSEKTIIKSMQSLSDDEAQYIKQKSLLVNFILYMLYIEHKPNRDAFRSFIHSYVGTYTSMQELCRENSEDIEFFDMIESLDISKCIKYDEYFDTRMSNDFIIIKHNNQLHLYK